MAQHVTAVVYSPDTGRIHQSRIIAPESDARRVTLVTGPIDIHHHYIDDGGALRDRPELRATLDRDRIAADGEDTATIGPLPIPCQVKIGGQETVVIDDGEIEITADQPDEIEVEIDQWPYYPKTFVIVAGDDG